MTPPVSTQAVAFGPMPLSDVLLLRAGLRVVGMPWRTATRENCDVFFAATLDDLPPPTRSGPRSVVVGPRRPSAVSVISANAPPRYANHSGPDGPSITIENRGIPWPVSTNRSNP